MAGTHAGEVLEGGQAGAADKFSAGLERAAQAAWGPGQADQRKLEQGPGPSSQDSLVSRYAQRLAAEGAASGLKYEHGNLVSAPGFEATYEKGQLKEVQLNCGQGKVKGFEKDKDIVLIHDKQDGKDKLHGYTNVSNMEVEPKLIDGKVAETKVTLTSLKGVKVDFVCENK